MTRKQKKTTAGDLKILFISHDASRTGAPILLLHFIKWLKKNTSVSFQILLRNGGDLKHEFEELAKTWVFYRQPKSNMLIFRILHRIFLRPFVYRLKHFFLRNYLKKQNFTHIYSNTILNGDVLHFFKFNNAACISHLHELDHTIESIGIKNFDLIRQHSDYYITVSEYVKKKLVENFLIDSYRIFVRYGFVEVPKLLQNKELIQKELGVEKDYFVVGGSGNVDWRKGADIFVQVAAKVKQLQPLANIQFLWVGNNSGYLENSYRQVLYEAKQLGIANSLIFTGLVPNPFDYFNVFDLFVLSSREDPFPLACLENAMLKKPTICFENAGGMPEFVSENAGFAVPFLQIEEMAKRILELFNNREKLAAMGQAAHEKVLKNHSIENACNEIYNHLKKLC